jgi:nucleoside-diphosphate-sugar epimerase
MTIDNTERVALVAGGIGIVGHAVAAELKRQGWTVRALARRPILDMDTIPVDLTDREATASALKGAADTTHLFYAALSQDPDLAVEAECNGRMLGNVLDGLEAAGASLQRVISYEGFKIYGIHLGANVRTPARESDPSHMPPNIYLSQQAQLKARAANSAWDNVALRPDVVVGDIFGNPINIALVVGVFAELSRELGVPLRFPASDKAYRQLVQFTDAGLLARASAWAAMDEKASGEAFNCTNGDVFRWERMWEDIARHLALEIGAAGAFDPRPTHGRQGPDLEGDRSETWSCATGSDEACRLAFRRLYLSYRIGRDLRRQQDLSVRIYRTDGLHEIANRGDRQP